MYDVDRKLKIINSKCLTCLMFCLQLFFSLMVGKGLYLQSLEHGNGLDDASP